MGKHSKRVQRSKTRSIALLSLTQERKKADDAREQSYRENKSNKLIQKYDPEIKGMRLETEQERRERLLSNDMEIKAKAGLETTILATEINEQNSRQPVTTTPSTHVYPSTVHDVPKEHPLWRNLGKIPPSKSTSNQWTLSRTLATDKFGFHTDIVEDLCKKNNSRYFTDTEKVFLSTQVNLMLSLSRTNRNNLLESVKDMCKRMGITSPDGSDTKLWKHLSVNTRRWSDEFEIRPIWEGTDSPTTILTYSSEVRKQLKKDYELFRGYSFNTRDSAELANQLNGTDRASNTIAEWKADGSPKDRDLPTTTEKKDMPMTTTNTPSDDVIKNYTKVGSSTKDFYPTDAKYWVTSKGEPCKDCGNSHCQDNLVDIPSVMVKTILAIKDGVLDWRQLVEDDVRVEVASKTEDETKALRLELQQKEQQLKAVMVENQDLMKQLEAVNHATTEKEKEIRDLLS